MGLNTLVRRLAARLPEEMQHRLRKRKQQRRLKGNDFNSEEPEFALMSELLAPGDWAIDVGANVGHYTLRMAAVVGPAGRVIAFEPVPATFEILAASCRRSGRTNITLINAAVSDTCAVVHMSVPITDTGMKNFYQASIVADAPTNALQSVSALTLPVDALPLPRVPKLIKIDAEGHELSVLRGMDKLIRQHMPLLIVEASNDEIGAHIRSVGYDVQVLPGSPNYLCRRPGQG